MKCRLCHSSSIHDFINLGLQPLANSYLSKEDLNLKEPMFPLDVKVCGDCFLVQLAEYQSSEEIFREYAYFSSFATSWLKHCEDYTQKMISRFGLTDKSLVVEVASNDGYLLQYFKQRNIPVLGVEPARNVAKDAEAKGIRTITDFFGQNLGQKLKADKMTADLLIGNNVLAHVPDINDFVSGMPLTLKESGVITLEFPHLMQLIKQKQFDTIYHEHFSYLSLTSVATLMKRHGLRVFDVDQIPTHGGSLRVYICHDGSTLHKQLPSVALLLQEESDWGVSNLASYTGFEKKVNDIRTELLAFLKKAKSENKKVAAYGAPAKGNTLLNFCSVHSDLVQFTVDRNPYKQEKFLPGSQIPIHSPDDIFAEKPDYLVILPWNLRDEISQQMSGIRDWGGKFVTAIPQLEIW